MSIFASTNVATDLFGRPAEPNDVEESTTVARVIPLRTKTTEDTAATAVRLNPGDNFADLVGDLRQKVIDTSDAAYNEALLAAGLSPLTAQATEYLRHRMTSPAIVISRGITDGYGGAALPDPGAGRAWSSKVTAHANRPTHLVALRWHTPNGETCGQVRWMVPRCEEVEGKGQPDEYKYDFGHTGGLTADRVVDALHAKPNAPVVIIAEGLGKTDVFGGLIGHDPVFSIVGMAGVDGASEGRSRLSNPSATVARLAPEVLLATGGVEGKHVVIAADADFTTNPGVHQAIRVRLAAACARAGAVSVRITTVPTEVVDAVTGEALSLGASAGVDDYFAAMAEHYPNRDDVVRELLLSAITREEALRQWRDFAPTDKGRGARLAEEVMHQGWAYIPQSDSWRHWTGTHHSHDLRGNGILRLAGEVAGYAWGNSKAETATARAAGQSAQAMRNAATVAKGHDSIHGSHTDWQPRKFAHFWPASNGTVNLDTGNVEPGAWHREHMNPFVGPVAYRSDARSQAWDEYRRKIFLRLVEEPIEGVSYERDKDGICFEYDKGLERMFQECVGSWYYSRGQRVGLICKGAGQSGLGTMVNAILATMGDDAHDVLPAAALAGRANQFSTSSMPNRRVVIASEQSGTMTLDEALWRLLTQDGDQVPVEAKGQHPYKTQVTWSLVIMTNVLPRLVTSNTVHQGNETRAVIAEFPRSVSANDKSDRWERDLFTQEAQEAILAWGIEGAIRFAENGHKVQRTEQCEELVTGWLGTGDVLGGFVEDALEQCPVGAPAGQALNRATAYDVYTTWCDHQEISQQHRKRRRDFLSSLEGRKQFGKAKRTKKADDTDGPWGWPQWRIKPDWKDRAEDRNEF